MKSIRLTEDKDSVYVDYPINVTTVYTPDKIIMKFDPPLKLNGGMTYTIPFFVREYEAQRIARELADITKSSRRKLLESAIEIIDGDRNVQYGDPNADFKRIAQIWNAYLSGIIEKKWEKDEVESIQNSLLEPHDVAAMMIGLKLSRLSWSPENEDSWKDAAGYAGCGWDCITQSKKDQESSH